MRKSLFRCVVLAGLAAGVASCSPQKPPAPPPPRVTVSQPQTATVTNWDEYPGHLDAIEMVELRPRVAGYLDSIHFQDGAEVKAGDLLVVIDPRPYQAELEHAQAQREQAESRLALAGDDLKRAESLRGTKAISVEEYDSRSKAAQEAEGSLAAARAAETTARINLDYTQIKAPIAGRIGRRLVTPGNFVQLGGNGGAATVLATIVSQDPIYCYFDVDEAAFARYRNTGKAGQAAELQGGALVCELGLVNEDGFGHIGRLDFFDNQVNPQTGTIRMRAVFDNPGRALVPGMFARLRVPAGPPEPALLVPDVAIQSDQGYKFVYVVNSANKVETRSITTGRAHDTLRAVLKGLTPQDRVAVNGLMMLRDGIQVEVQSPEPAVPGSRAAGESGAVEAKAQP
ncbi:MAG TPA: efflux RND transporter periplasmic adaptor subunit [Candidatus Binatia bacterium]|jgi:RND family efflux transporter MFP subunit|nr:efflux RND transporter periplasmic adaptor subunit [Candidatus Binatia bacterium]